jgi:dipeptidyl aminopeptidase/acylaminoacyl peptidase
MSSYFRYALVLAAVVLLGGCTASSGDPVGTPVDAVPPTELSVTDEATATQETIQPLPATRIPPTNPEGGVLTPTLPDPTQSGCAVETPQPSAGILRLAFAAADGNLYLQDGSETPQPLTDSGDVVEVQISDDGNLIAYERNPEGYPPELWVVNADGSNAHRVLGEPAIEGLDPLIAQSGLGYWLNFQWIPYHHELIVYVGEYQSADQSYERLIAVYRLDPISLALARFPATYYVPSPDGEWFAMTEDNSLTLIRTDGTQELHKVLDGYRWIGITSYYALPPLVWMEDRVRVIFPRQDYPEGDPRYAPFEIWDVFYEAGALQVGTIEGDDSQSLPMIDFIFFAPNGKYYTHSDSNNSVILGRVGGETIRLGDGPLGYVWWNPTSTHFLHQIGALRLDDICGNTITTPIEGQWAEWGEGIAVKWIDPARAFIMRHGLTDNEGNTPPGGAYLYATDGSLTLLADQTIDADAVLIP